VFTYVIEYACAEHGAVETFVRPSVTSISPNGGFSGVFFVAMPV
jgi:hypothetical protein